MWLLCFLQKFAKLEMESMVYTGYAAGVSGSSYEFTGDLGLVQKQPLWSRYHDTRYNQQVVPLESLKVKDYSLNKIIREYAARNGKNRNNMNLLLESNSDSCHFCNILFASNVVSTILKNKYEIWTSSSYSKEFSVKGRIMYTEDSFQVWAEIWQMLKWAWIQYFCVFVIVYAIFRAFQRTVYKARLFETMLIIPWEKRQPQINF